MLLISSSLYLLLRTEGSSLRINIYIPPSIVDKHACMPVCETYVDETALNYLFIFLPLVPPQPFT